MNCANYNIATPPKETETPGRKKSAFALSYTAHFAERTKLALANEPNTFCTPLNPNEI